MVDLKDFLTTLNFSDLEVDVYEAILYDGCKNCGELSEMLAKPRTTVTRKIDKLVAKGFLKKIKKGRECELQPEPPEFLCKIITTEKNRIENRLNHLNELAITAESAIELINKSISQQHTRNSTRNISVQHLQKASEIQEIYI